MGQVSRAGEIIRRLREFVKKSEPERREANILALIEEASALALIGAHELGVAVRFQTAFQLPPAHVDKVQVQQVLVNLIRNAVEAMQASERREITIETTLDEDGLIRIGIIYSAEGSHPEIMDRLFQPFVTTKSQGMGVGLSLCRAIVEAHGGRLWAEPNPDGGTIFRFTVPPLERKNPVGLAVSALLSAHAIRGGKIAAGLGDKLIVADPVHRFDAADALECDRRMFMEILDEFGLRR